MTYQSSLPAAGFRELSPRELDAISGGNGSLYGDEYLGNIVVTGIGGGGFNFGGLGGIGGIGSLGVAGSGLIGLPIPSDWTLPPEDLDGDGEPGITVTGEKFEAPEGFTLGPVNPSTGLIHIMYPNGPDGQPDYTQPPVLTPDGEAFACEAYAEGMNAINNTTGQGGTLGFLGIAYQPGNLFFISGIAGLTTTYSPPAHCQ